MGEAAKPHIIFQTPAHDNIFAGITISAFFPCISACHHLYPFRNIDEVQTMVIFSHSTAHYHADMIAP